jgi:hypothetical protein
MGLGGSRLGLRGVHPPPLLADGRPLNKPFRFVVDYARSGNRARIAVRSAAYAGLVR